ncbi:MAG: hypothetical protein Tsb0019_06940 [Roseibium sp.]
MPSIIIWNIQHSSGFQDTFSAKNAFINEVLGNCVQTHKVSAIILLEVTDTNSVNQFAQNRGFHASIHGQGSTLKYAILTNYPHEVTDATDYFGSFAGKPRGIVHVACRDHSGFPPLLVTHIKSDLGKSGAACLGDIGQQMKESMSPASAKWPSSGAIAVADWNLESDQAVQVASMSGGRIVAPREPTRYPFIPPQKILQPVGGGKVLDYACVFGGLAASNSFEAFVPDVFHLRSVMPLLEGYLKQIVDKVNDLDQKNQKIETELMTAMNSGNFSLVGMNAVLDEQSKLSGEKNIFDNLRLELTGFMERIARHDRLDQYDKQVVRQLFAQAGIGPDHMPVIISW